MKQKKNSFVQICLTTLLLVVICDYAVSETHATKDATTKDASKEVIKKSVLNTSSVQISKQGLYHVSFRSNVDPIPLNQVHSWIIHVETAKGKPIEDAKIAVYGGMPKHKHGLPTAPRITRNMGKGDYLMEGLKFSMSGEWEVWLNIRVKGKSDKVAIIITM